MPARSKRTGTRPSRQSKEGSSKSYSKGGGSRVSSTKSSRGKSRRSSRSRSSRSRLNGKFHKIGPASDNRMLKSKLICPVRPEMLGILDFKPIYEGSDNLSPAGELFELRNNLRITDIESVKSTLEEVKNSSPDAYKAALQQYESSLASSYTEVSMLKLVLLMRKYAELSTSFSDFIGKYDFPSGYDFDYAGDSFNDYLKNVMKLTMRGSNNDITQYGTIALLQLIADLDFTINFGSPDSLDVRNRRWSSSSPNINVKYVNSFPEMSAVYTSTFIGRNLSASLALNKIRDGDASASAELTEYINTYLGEDWVTKSSKQNGTLFEAIAGWEKWSSSGRNISKYRSESRRKEVKATSMLQRNKTGLLSSLKDGSYLYPEKGEVTLKSTRGRDRTFKSMKDKVDTIFAAIETANMDFTEYKEITDNIVTPARALAESYKILFRLLDRQEKDTEENYSGLAVLDNEQPLSPASVFTICLQVLQDRFFLKLNDSLYTKNKGSSADPPTEYLRTAAYVWIKENPSNSKKLVRYCIEDFLSGFLSYKGIPEIPEADPETGDAEDPEDPEFINPLTEEPATITASTSRRLNGAIYSMFTRIDNGGANYGIMSDFNPSQVAGGVLIPGKIGDNKVDLPAEDQRTCSVWFKENITTGGTNYYYSKIVAAEIIDCFMTILRKLISSVEEIEPVEEGDPFFPNCTNAPGPYGNGSGNSTSFCDSSMANMETEYWVPTLQAFFRLFTRTGDQTLTYSGSSIQNFVETLVDIVYKILKTTCDQYTFQRRSKRYTYSNSDGEIYKEIKYWWLCMAVKSSTMKSSRHKDFAKKCDNAVAKILETTASRLESSSYNASGDQTAVRRLSELHGFCKETLVSLMQDELSVGLGFDMIDSYADRVESYASAAIDTLSSGEEDGSLQEYLQALYDSGTGGQDILQNVNPEQLALKTVTIERQTGNPDEGYLPDFSIVTEQDIKALEVLNENISVIGTEGLNLRTLVVGLPSGMLQEKEIKDTFTLRVNNVDVEYADIVFKTKNFNYNPDLYVLSSDLEDINFRSINSFSSLVKRVDFSKINFEISEGGDNDSGIAVEETDESERADSSSLDLYSNHLISYLLEVYYRLMVGVDINEDTFMSVSEPLGLEINSYASDLSSAVSSFYSDLEADAGDKFSEILTSATDIASNYQSLISNFSSEIVTGEFTDLDAEMLAKFRNTHSVKLFSGEAMRDRIISAKVFDRIFMLLVDPDEFEVAIQSNVKRGQKYTDKKVFDRYVKKGVIVNAGSESDPTWKLAPRSMNEGTMGFNKFFITVGEGVDDGDSQVDLS